MDIPEAEPSDCSSMSSSDEGRQNVRGAQRLAVSLPCSGGFREFLRRTNDDYVNETFRTVRSHYSNRRKFDKNASVFERYLQASRMVYNHCTDKERLKLELTARRYAKDKFHARCIQNRVERPDILFRNAEEYESGKLAAPMPLCEFPFGDAKTIESIGRYKTLLSNRLICDLCPVPTEAFTTAHSYFVHMSQHHDVVTLFACHVCHRGFESKEALIGHHSECGGFQVECATSLFKIKMGYCQLLMACTDCGEHFVMKSSLIGASATQQWQRLLLFNAIHSSCSMVLVQVLSLKAVTYDVTLDVIPSFMKNIRIGCIDCGIDVFDSVAAASEHYTEKHSSDDTMFKCPKCTSLTADEAMFRLHLLTHITNVNLVSSLFLGDYLKSTATRALFTSGVGHVGSSQTFGGIAHVLPSYEPASEFVSVFESVPSTSSDDNATATKGNKMTKRIAELLDAKVPEWKEQGNLEINDFGYCNDLVEPSCEKEVSIGCTPSVDQLSTNILSSLMQSATIQCKLFTSISGHRDNGLDSSSGVHHGVYVCCRCNAICEGERSTLGHLAGCSPELALPKLPSQEATLFDLNDSLLVTMVGHPGALPNGRLMCPQQDCMTFCCSSDGLRAHLLITHAICADMHRQEENRVVLKTVSDVDWREFGTLDRTVNLACGLTADGEPPHVYEKNTNHASDSDAASSIKQTSVVPSSGKKSVNVAPSDKSPNHDSTSASVPTCSKNSTVSALQSPTDDQSVDERVESFVAAILDAVEAKKKANQKRQSDDGPSSSAIGAIENKRKRSASIPATETLHPAKAKKSSPENVIHSAVQENNPNENVEPVRVVVPGSVKRRLLTQKEISMFADSSISQTKIRVADMWRECSGSVDAPPEELQLDERPWSPADEEEVVLDCSFCGLKLTSRDSMVSHLQSHTESKTTCYLCKPANNCESFSQLKQHFLDVHSVETMTLSDGSGGGRRCSFCSMDFDEKSLMAHLIYDCYMSGCGICGAGSSTSKAHERSQHQKKSHRTEYNRFVCINCNKQFAYWDWFTEHKCINYLRCAERSCDVKMAKKDLKPMVEHVISAHIVDGMCLICASTKPLKTGTEAIHATSHIRELTGQGDLRKLAREMKPLCKKVVIDSTNDTELRKALLVLFNNDSSMFVESASQEVNEVVLFSAEACTSSFNVNDKSIVESVQIEELLHNAKDCEANEEAETAMEVENQDDNGVAPGTPTDDADESGFLIIDEGVDADESVVPASQGESSGCLLDAPPPSVMVIGEKKNNSAASGVTPVGACCTVASDLTPAIDMEPPPSVVCLGERTRTAVDIDGSTAPESKETERTAVSDDNCSASTAVTADLTPPPSVMLIEEHILPPPPPAPVLCTATTESSSPVSPPFSPLPPPPPPPILDTPVIPSSDCSQEGSSQIVIVIEDDDEANESEDQPRVREERLSPSVNLNSSSAVESGVEDDGEDVIVIQKDIRKAAELKSQSQEADSSSNVAASSSVVWEVNDDDEEISIAVPAESTLRDSVSRPKTHKCSMCSEAFYSATSRKIHEKEKHRQNIAVEARTCEEDFGIPRTGVSYICRLCMAAFESGEMFTKHMRAHDISAPNSAFYCNHCSGFSIQQNELERHLERHQAGAITYRCVHCDPGLIYKEESQLIEHIRTFHKHPVFAFCKRCCFGSCDLLEVWKHIASKCYFGKVEQNNPSYLTMGFVTAAELAFQPANIQRYKKALADNPKLFVTMSTCSHRSLLRFQEMFTTCADRGDQCYGISNGNRYLTVYAAKQGSTMRADGAVLPPEGTSQPNALSIYQAIRQALIISMGAQSTATRSAATSRPPSELRNVLSATSSAAATQVQQAAPIQARPNTLAEALMMQNQPVGNPRQQLGGIQYMEAMRAQRQRQQYQMMQQQQQLQYQQQQQQLQHQAASSRRQLALNPQQQQPQQRAPQEQRLAYRQLPNVILPQGIPSQAMNQAQIRHLSPSFAQPTSSATVPYHHPPPLISMAAVQQQSIPTGRCWLCFRIGTMPTFVNCRIETAKVLFEQVLNRPQLRSYRDELLAIALKRFEVERIAVMQICRDHFHKLNMFNDHIAPGCVITNIVDGQVVQGFRQWINAQPRTVVVPQPSANSRDMPTFAPCDFCFTPGIVYNTCLMLRLLRGELRMRILKNILHALPQGQMNNQQKDAVTEMMSRREDVAHVCIRHVNPSAIGFTRGQLCHREGEASHTVEDYRVNYASLVVGIVASRLATATESYIANSRSPQFTMEHAAAMLTTINSLNVCNISDCRAVNPCLLPTRNLRLHHLHNSNHSWICRDCPATGESESFAVAHCATAHMKGVTTMLYELDCPVMGCRNRFDSIALLRRHINTVHRTLVRHESDFCAAHFASDALARKHDADHKEGNACCYLCGLGACWTLSSVAHHLKVGHDLFHALDLQIYCKCCATELGESSVDALVAHFVAVHLQDVPGRKRCIPCQMNLNHDEVRKHALDHHKLSVFSVRLRDTAAVIRTTAELNSSLGLPPPPPQPPKGAIRSPSLTPTKRRGAAGPSSGRPNGSA